MNALFKKAGTVLGTIWVWSLLWVLASAGLVWWLGPLLAVDDVRFWQGTTARLVTISVLFLLWGLAMVVVGARRAVGLNTPEGEAHHQQPARAADEQRHVRGRFKEALQRLKTCPRYAPHNARWRNDLPWYVLIGEQGSGKTRLLAAAGLQSPLDRVEAMPGADTAHCEFYFADGGVLIDTPGRYLTQPDPAVDGVGWSTLLNLLRLRRRARPLNGVVLTLSVQTLLNDNEHDLQHRAGQVHSRLQEIRQVLRADVPVYLVLTQADRVPGFSEFFDAAVMEDDDSVLGQRFDAGETSVDIAQVRQAFETLLQRLGAQLITRLHQERNVERRGQMLDFPQQAAQIGERLCLFAESAFSAHRYQRINGLRGFYLTCADDRRSHFVQGLFNQVIFAEADLAGLQTQEQQRIRRHQGLRVAAAALIVGGAGWLWAHSYSVNEQRLAQLAALVSQPSPAPEGADQTLAFLALLDARLAATQIFPPAQQVSFTERGGLYQGETSRPVLSRAYEHALQQPLLSRVTAELEDQVRASLGERQHLLDNLRAYLMLNLRERRDNGWLAQHMATVWSARFAGDAPAQKRLNEHLARLLKQPFVAPLDEALVAKAREELRGESLADGVYRVLREQSRNLEPLRLAQGEVFAGIDPPVPGFYTKRYWQYFEAQGPRLVNAIAQDNWVMGEGSDLSVMDLHRLMTELQQRYFSEYADTWSAALGRISLQPTDTLRQDAEQLANLTSARSPLMQLLLLIRDNTRLLPAHEPSEKASQLGALVQSAAVEVQAAAFPDSARRALQRRFEPLHQLLDEQQNPGVELTQALRLLDELHLQLTALNRESSPEQAAFQRVKRRMEGQQDVLGNLRDAAARLPLPLAGWFEGLADDSWRHLLEGAYTHVNGRYQSEVYGVYAKAIRQRYPFNAHGTSDVALNDFQEFFKPQGVLARFVEGYLRPFVGVDGSRYKLRGLDGNSLAINRSLLDQLTKAQTIRRSFFTEEQDELSVRFTLAPYSLDQSVSRATLRLGEKQLEYRHGPIVPMAFAWPMEADTSCPGIIRCCASSWMRAI
ncbi:type VI secretion system membrane subunit TssM [Pseudomonas fluorescens]|uniref:type VI secretion system membrane subunit TssM n=1 Tax=Pseudomonas fluorescens TaxID=294 RepID=UPI00099AA68C|nr:type VI secretion system membrane subunit TssM [Pseudomonas fluorescens]